MGPASATTRRACSAASPPNEQGGASHGAMAPCAHPLAWGRCLAFCIRPPFSSAPACLPLLPPLALPLRLAPALSEGQPPRPRHALSPHAHGKHHAHFHLLVLAAHALPLGELRRIEVRAASGGGQAGGRVSSFKKGCFGSWCRSACVLNSRRQCIEEANHTVQSLDSHPAKAGPPCRRRRPAAPAAPCGPRGTHG